MWIKTGDKKSIVRANANEKFRRAREVHQTEARMLAKDNLRIAAYLTMPVYCVSFTLLRLKHRRGVIFWGPMTLSIHLR